MVEHCSTVQRHLHQYDLLGRVSIRKPFLRSHQNNQHQKCAKEHLNKPDSFRKQVLWTDEDKIERFGCNEQRYVWREKGAELHENNTSNCSAQQWISHALGLCSSQWDRGHFTGRGREGGSYERDIMHWMGQDNIPGW